MENEEEFNNNIEDEDLQELTYAAPEDVGGMDIVKFSGRIIGNAYYDFQGVRIACMNRIRDVIRKRIEGLPFDVVEKKKEKDKDGKKVKEKKYTDEQLIEKWGNLLKEKKITKKEHDYIIKIWNTMLESKNIENKYKSAMQKYVEKYEIYTEFLSKIKGIGPVLSVNLVKEFGTCEVIVSEKATGKIIGREKGDHDGELEKALVLYKEHPDLYSLKGYHYVSRLWSHSGNNVNAEGKSPKLKKGEKPTWSPHLRALTWKISDSLLKGNKGVYRRLYNTEKEKQLAIVYQPGVLFKKYGKPYKEEDTHLSKLHAHNRALKKMRKLFLAHYWEAARQIAGLPTPRPFVEQVLKHSPLDTISWKDAIAKEDMLKKTTNEVEGEVEE